MHTPEQAVQEAMELAQGLKRLTHMAGVDSIARNLEAEDEAVRRNVAQCEGALHGGDSGLDAVGGDDPMRIMAARDVHVYQPATAGTAAPSSPQAGAADRVGGGAVPSPDPTVAETPLWKKAAALAAIMAGCGGTAGLASYAAAKLATPETAAEVPTAEGITELGYGVTVEKASGDDATP